MKLYLLSFILCLKASAGTLYFDKRVDVHKLSAEVKVSSGFDCENTSSYSITQCQIMGGIVTQIDWFEEPGVRKSTVTYNQWLIDTTSNTVIAHTR